MGIKLKVYWSTFRKYVSFFDLGSVGPVGRGQRVPSWQLWPFPTGHRRKVWLWKFFYFNAHTNTFILIPILTGLAKGTDFEGSKGSKKGRKLCDSTMVSRLVSKWRYCYGYLIKTTFRAIPCIYDPRGRVKVANLEPFDPAQLAPGTPDRKMKHIFWKCSDRPSIWYPYCYGLKTCHFNPFSEQKVGKFHDIKP